MLYFELLFCSRPRALAARIYNVKLPTWNKDYLSIYIFSDNAVLLISIQFRAEQKSDCLPFLCSLRDHLLLANWRLSIIFFISGCILKYSIRGINSSGTSAIVSSKESTSLDQRPTTILSGLPARYFCFCTGMRLLRMLTYTVISAWKNMYVINNFWKP